jgi:hypothetical protein
MASPLSRRWVAVRKSKGAAMIAVSLVVASPLEGLCDQSVAQPAVVQGQPQLAFPIPPPPADPPNFHRITNASKVVAHDNGTNSVAPSGSMATDLLRRIAFYQGELNKTNLPPILRSMYNTNLALLSNTLAIFGNGPKFNLSSIPKPPSMPELIGSGTNAVPSPRAMNPMLQQAEAEMRTNRQMWKNLVKAQVSHNKPEAARAERELADYLAVQLGKINGKTYPSGMSLAAIMKEYGAKASEKPFNRRKVVLVILVAVMLTPLFLFAFYKLRHRNDIIGS